MNINPNLLAVAILVALFNQTFSYPDVQRNQNQDNVDNSARLHQIEEEAVDPNSQINLKRSSRKVECPFAKLKSAKSSSSSRMSKCPFSTKNSSPQKSYKVITSLDESGEMSSFITQFSFIVEELFIQMKALMDIMPIALDNIKNQAILVPGLIEDVEITSDSCAKTQKDLSGFFDFFGNIFKFSKPGPDHYETENIDVSGCLETIKDHLLSFLGFLKPCMKNSEDIYVQRISKIEKLLEHLSPSKFKSLSSACILPQKTFKYPSLFQKHSSSIIGNCNEDISLTDQIHTLRELSVFMDQFPLIINEMMEAVKGVSQTHGQIKEILPNVKSHPSLAHLWPHASCQSSIKSDFLDTIHKYYLRPNFENTNFDKVIEPTRVFQLPPRTQPPTCSGQSIIDQIAMKIASNRRGHNLDGSMSTQNFNTYSIDTKNDNTYLSSSLNFDLSNTKITLDRSTIQSFLYGGNLHAGDIIIINITNDIMLVGGPSDDSSPIVFNIINRAVSHQSPYNYNTIIWNLSSQDFSCNPQIYSDIISDLII